MGTQHPALEQAYDTMRTRQEVLAHLAVPLADHPMVVAQTLQPVVRRQPVRMHHAPGRYALLDRSLQALTGVAGHPPQANAADARPVLLSGHHNQGLAGRPAAMLPRLLSAPVRLIYLHRTAETVPSRPHHRSAQLVQPDPRRLVAAQAKDPLQPQGTDTSLLVDHMPHRSKPQPQRLVGVLKDGAGRHGGLQTALGTLLQPALQRPSPVLAAAWTSRSVGPTPLKQVLATRLFRSEASLELQDGARVVLHTRPAQPSNTT